MADRTTRCACEPKTRRQGDRLILALEDEGIDYLG